MTNTDASHNLIRCALFAGMIWLIAGVATAVEPPDLEWSPTPLLLSEAEATALCVSARKALLGAADALDGLPRRLRNDAAMRAVFLSVSDGKTTAHSGLGFGKGIAAAIRNAADKARVRLPQGAKRDVAWLKLDIVQKTATMPELRTAVLLLRGSAFQGIVLDWRAELAWLPAEAFAHNVRLGNSPLWAPKFPELTQKVRGDAGRLKELLAQERISAVRFSTTSLLLDGNRAVWLYQGHRLWAEIRLQDLRAAAIHAGDYLLAAMRDNGSFTYIYFPASGKTSRKYNVLRHAGTLVAMLDLYSLTRDKALLASARRGLDALQRDIRPYGPAKAAMSCVVKPNGSVPLGGAALAVVAFAKYEEVTGEKTFSPVMLRLGNYIVNSIRADGSFISRRDWDTGEIAEWQSKYYPGEALLALMRLHQRQPDDKWVEAAVRGAEWLINVRDKRPLAKLIHDHWLLYALNELHRVRPEPMFVNHTLRISRAIRMSQTHRAKSPDWLGSYNIPPRTTPTTTRTEGLLAAYALLRRTDDVEEAQRLLEAIHLGMAFQLQLQIRPETAMIMADPARALGGVRNKFDSYAVRIDYCQHFVSAALLLDRVLQEERGVRLAMSDIVELLQDRELDAFPWRESAD